MLTATITRPMPHLEIVVVRPDAPDKASPRQCAIFRWDPRLGRDGGYSRCALGWYHPTTGKIDGLMSVDWGMVPDRSEVASLEAALREKASPVAG